MRMNGFYLIPVLALSVLVLLAGCGQKQIEQEPAGQEQTGQKQPSYTQISQEEAKEMMDSGEDIIILDVRTQAEYDSGHIPGAVLLPNEDIGTEEIESLPDKEQVILIYCRSGNRSKQAAGKLAALGYTNLYEFGGITTWPYETTK